MSDCQKCTLPPSAPPAATPPTPPSPEPWDELAAFRETTLRHFTRAEDRASLARLGQLLAESALEQAHLWPPLDGSETTNGARAAYRDLLHTLTFLHHLGEARHQSTLPQPEAVLAAIAARTVRRLLPEVERLREAIERCEAAEGRVH